MALPFVTKSGAESPVTEGVFEMNVEILNSPASSETCRAVPAEAPEVRVRVTDIDLPFWSIVVVMLKWTTAAIPAVVLLVIAFGMVAGLFVGTSPRHLLYT
jgi:hypothetical protein